MKTITFILILFSLVCHSQHIAVNDSLQRIKIEQWMVENTFPNVIQFIEDANGNWCIGAEVLRDPAYQKLELDVQTIYDKLDPKDPLYEKVETIQGKEVVRLADLLTVKSEPIIFEPVKTSDDPIKEIVVTPKK